MSKGLRHAASYLKGLAADGYAIPPVVSSTVNYLLDSWWAKIDYRASLLEQREIPLDPKSHIQELWLGCEEHTFLSLNRTYPSFAKSRNAWGFCQLFSQYAGEKALYDIVPFVDQYENKDMVKRFFRIQHEPLHISFAQEVSLPVYGTFFVQSKLDGSKLIVSFDFCYDGPRCSITIVSNPANKSGAEKFLHDLDVSIATNDIYFQKCLSFVQGYLDFAAVKPTTWNDVVLREDTKSVIRVNTIGVLDHMEELARIGMCPNRNIMLISPPGMAKTTMFRAISNEVDSRATRIWCTGKSIQYPEHVTALFEAARSLAPCLIFIEDMDLFGGDRSIGRNSYVLNEFLTCLDGTQANAGIIVLASTNDMLSMDEALVNRPGRFSVKVDIPFPDERERSMMLSLFFKQFSASPDKQSVTKQTWKTVMDMTEGLTGDYMKELANSTILFAVSAGRGGTSVTFTADDLTKAAEKVVKDYALGKLAHRHHNISHGEVVAKG